MRRHPPELAEAAGRKNTWYEYLVFDGKVAGIDVDELEVGLEGRKFNYATNERLFKALELKLFEDRKDSIKLTSLVSNVVDKETQEKIDIVKGRLIKTYGYCDVCATDVLNYVASIFARGDAKE